MRQRTSATLFVLLVFTALALFAPAAMALPRGAAPDPRALLAVQQAQLAGSDGAANDSFGFSVALSGDTALVGAIGHAVGANDGLEGAAYVFTRSGATWTQQGPALTASEGAAGDWFGSSVALDGDTAVVGALLTTVGGKSSQGAAYVFVRSGTTWSRQGPALTAADGQANSQFGSSVAVSGDTVLVGASGRDFGGPLNQGGAYVFTRTAGVWTQQGETLLAGDAAANDHFGTSVSLDGDTALIGAPTRTAGASSEQGGAYVFTRSGATWTQQGAVLLAADGAGGDQFGYSVAVSGDTALVGARYHTPGASGTQGSAYVYTRSGTAWSQQGGSLVASDGAAGDQFGTSVGLDGDTAVVGARYHVVGTHFDQGAAWLFSRTGTAWSQQGPARLASNGAGGDKFGTSVAVSGTTALVGAPSRTVGANGAQGAAYVIPPRLSAPTSPKTTRPGKRFTVAGILTPHVAAGTRTVTLKAYRLVHRTWRFFKAYTAVNADTATGTTRYAVKLALTGKGTYRFRAQTGVSKSTYSRRLTVK